MEKAQLVLEYMRVLVWPAIVLVLLWILRRQLRQAFDRLVKIGLPGGMTLELERRTADLAEQAEEAVTTEIAVSGDASGEGTATGATASVGEGDGHVSSATAERSTAWKYAAGRRLNLSGRETPPALRMVMAWGILDGILQGAVSAYGTITPGASNPIESAKYLLHKRLIPESYYDLIREMAPIAAAVQEGVEPTDRTAEDFVTSIYRVVSGMRLIFRNDVGRYVAAGRAADAREATPPPEA